MRLLYLLSIMLSIFSILMVGYLPLILVISCVPVSDAADFEVALDPHTGEPRAYKDVKLTHIWTTGERNAFDFIKFSGTRSEVEALCSGTTQFERKYEIRDKISDITYKIHNNESKADLELGEKPEWSIDPDTGDITSIRPAYASVP